jgi:hypothetical protein
MTPEMLTRTLQDFLAEAASAVVLENGAVAFDLAQAKYSISGEYNKCLLHLWSAERNTVRRVLDAEEIIWTDLCPRADPAGSERVRVSGSECVGDAGFDRCGADVWNFVDGCMQREFPLLRQAQDRLCRKKHDKGGASRGVFSRRTHSVGAGGMRGGGAGADGKFESGGGEVATV